MALRDIEASCPHGIVVDQTDFAMIPPVAGGQQVG
jgi:hypothetical protein